MYLGVIQMKILYFTCLMSLIACGDKVTEGMTPGDCSDGADNDGDGLFDCNDDGCEGAPDCNGESDDTGTSEDENLDPADVDADGDGFSENDGDCDDSDPMINPETLDSVGDDVDTNCDGHDGIDADGDGFASEISGGIDCDDTDRNVCPGATDLWYDGVDSDCSGGSDYDQDGDGEDSDQYGGTDCDDLDGGINTSATDVWYDGIDQNCDGLNDYDQDGDGEDSDQYGGTDCDDLDVTMNTSATDLWYDGVDSDCSGGSDYDQDGDGEDSDQYGGTDCDDLDGGINTSATDVWYDGIDQNCDGLNDYDQDGDGEDSDQYGGTDCDDLDVTMNTSATDLWYDGVDSDCSGGSDYDQDGDGEDSDQYGGTDCDDTNPILFAGALDQTTDGVDQNCDGVDGTDNDGDGFADSAFGGTDCDDTASTVNPSAVEVFGNNVDDDCDGIADVQGASCTADFTFTLPNGDTATMDGCVDWNLSPIFNFDPQDPPWLRHFTVEFNGTNSAGFDCSVTIEQNNLCEDGFYDVQSASTSVVFVTTDCLDIPIQYESTYQGTEGYVRIDSVDTGNQGGSFINLPLLTSIDGHLSAESASGVDVQGDFSIALTQIAQFEEDTSTCDEVDISLIDADGDGVYNTYFGGDDCDDADASVMSMADDMDCDGVLTVDDCDDNDISLLAITGDMDCDGVLTVDDCDDNDSTSTTVATDNDCDGVLTSDDCDDADVNSNIVAIDGDCDGVLTADDCDDSDASTIYDMDCDGVITVDDCDDNDSTSTTVATDNDCDGVLTSDDCDDADVNSNIVAIDGDCDGVLTADDCDDGDVNSTIVLTDGDCDGVLTADDCDDADVTLLATAGDVDCDGVLTADDCDDTDPNTVDDMDCDGVLTVDDCDDGDENLLEIANDMDCDGVLTADDCDDGDASVDSIVHRMTKTDGSGTVLSITEELETNQGVPISDIRKKLNGSSLNHTTTVNYDANGTITSELVEFPNNADGWYAIEYDVDGKISSIENTQFSDGSSLLQEYTYDSSGHWNEHLLSGIFSEQISMTASSNTVEYNSSYTGHLFEYNGNTLIGYEKTDQHGDQLLRELDANGNLTLFENSIGIVPTVSLNFIYSNNQLVEMADNSLGNQWETQIAYTYDSQGQLIEKIYIDPYMTQYANSSSCLNPGYSNTGSCANNVVGDPHAKFTYTYANGSLTQVSYDTIAATNSLAPDVLYKDITAYDYIEQYTYFSSGSLESLTRYIDKDGDGVSNQVYQVEYDSDGNITAQGFVWNPGTYGYDSQNNFYFYYDIVDLSNGWPYSNVYAHRSEYTYQSSWSIYGIGLTPYYTASLYNIQTILDGNNIYSNLATGFDRFQYPVWTQGFDMLQSSYASVLDTYNRQATSRFIYDGDHLTRVETDQAYDNPNSMDIVSDFVYDVDGNITQVLVDINGDTVVDYAQNMQYDSFGELIYFEEDYENDGDPDTSYAVQITRDSMNSITEKAYDYDLDGLPEHLDVYNNQYSNGELIQVDIDFYDDNTIDEVQTYETVCE